MRGSRLLPVLENGEPPLVDPRRDRGHVRNASSELTDHAGRTGTSKRLFPPGTIGPNMSLKPPGTLRSTSVKPLKVPLLVIDNSS